jgi:serine/threonine protein kinase
MDLVDQTLGQFQIIEQVGKGGMALVYKAYQPNLQRNVAIKVLAPKFSDDMDLVKRFLREAQSAAALQHPNVIIIHDVGSEGDIHYIVTEFLEGMTLAQLLKEEGALSPERILHIVQQIANALDYAHSRGFIHRDIKPSNIMVDPSRDDHVTLMDFGLVQVTGGSRITRTGFIMGTPDYMSPEQAKGDPVDLRTDIYSLGVTVYHMLTGQVPFAKSTPHAVLLAHIMEDPPAMSTADADISFEIESVVRKAMNKDPADRYDWSGDLAADLEMAVDSPATFTAPPLRPSMYPQGPSTIAAAGPQYGPAQPTPTPPGGTAPHPQTPPGGVTPYPTTAPAPSAPKKRAKWVLPVIGLSAFAVLSILVIAGILLWPQIRPLLAGGPTPTVALASVATATPQPAIERFDVYPLQVTQGQEVTIEWQTSGASSVNIEPNIRQDAPPSGSMTHKPGMETTYKLVLPNGDTREITVQVAEAPGAPEIAYFRIEPQTVVRGGEVKLSWQVDGEHTRIEINQGFSVLPGLDAQGEMTVRLDQTTLFVLNAYNGELLSSQRFEVQVVDPSPTPTATPEPTATPQPTATRVPPTPTPTTAAQANTPQPRPATPTLAPAAGSGVVYAFEQWGTWKRGDQPYGELEQSTEEVKSGTYAAKLTYDYRQASASDDFVVFANLTSLAGEPNTISAWVYGDQSGHFVNMWIQDAEGQVWSVNLGTITFSGWQQMSGAIDPNRSWPSGKVFGPDNGAIDYPIRFYGIVLDRPGSGPTTGQIYLDDISATETEVVVQPGATATPEQGVPSPGQVGRIIFTIQVDKAYSLYSTDPSWSKAIKIGDTDYSHSTCPEENTVATALDGTTVGIRPIERCQIAGTVGSCPSPDGQWKVNTTNKGSYFSVVLWNVAENKQEEAYFQGKLNIYTGLNWAPDSSHFLFTVEQAVYRADVGQAGYYQILPFKDGEYPLQYSANGSMIMYPKPVNGAIVDIFVANPDGSGERNLTNAPISVKLCPRWKR